MQPISQLDRQAQHYKAVRERLFNRPTPKPVAVAPQPKPQLLLLRDFDAHVIAWRKWKRFSEALEKSVAFRSFSTQGSFEAILAPSPYKVEFAVGEEPWVPTLKRSMHDICLEVLRDFPGVTLAQIKGVHRFVNIVEARQTCMYVIKTERPDLSYPAIGRFFGDRDHTTVLHAVRKIQTRREGGQA